MITPAIVQTIDEARYRDGAAGPLLSDDRAI
jgi:hypothetical protein